MSANDTTPFPFPADLTELQARLYRARAEHEALCRTLPWSVEPMPGWEPVVNSTTNAVISDGRAPSPGYTPEQRAEDERLRALIRDLSTAVVTHVFWSTLERGPMVIEARTALQSHPDVLAVADGQPAAAEAA